MIFSSPFYPYIRMETKQSKRHGKRPARKRALFVCLTMMGTTAALTSLVFALQRDFSNSPAQHADINPPFSFSFAGNDNASGSISSTGSRGSIYDKNLNPLAFDISSTAAYVRPRILQNPRLAAEKIAAVLDQDARALLTRLLSVSDTILLDGNITPAAADRLTDLNLEGVFLTREHKRQYPYDSLAAHVIGFVDNKQGLDGIEYFYDSVLQGTDVNLTVLNSMDIPPEETASSKGVDLFLTLDTGVQKPLEDYLATLSKRYGATSAMAAIMDPDTGAVLAMTNLPSFDPNRFWKNNGKALHNQILEPFMPGGFKSFLRQACFFDESIRLAKEKTITRRRAEQSAENRLFAPDKFKRKIDSQDTVFDSEFLFSLIEKLSFYETSAIDLPAMACNSQSEEGSKDMDSATGLQLLTGFCSAVNNGRSVAPHVLNMVMDKDTGHIYHRQSDMAKPADDLQKESQQAKALTILHHLGKQSQSGDFFLEALLHPEDKTISLHESLATDTQESENMPAADYMMLGLIGKGDSSLAIFIALRNADPALLSEKIGRPSLPLAMLDKDFVNKVVRLGSAPAATPTLALLKQPQYLQPDKTKTSRNAPQIARTEKMPHVIGKSLRRGLRDLQGYNLKIAIVGSGLIVKQQPSSGKAVAAGDLCTLRLQDN
jgi:hypothetical protein